MYTFAVIYTHTGMGPTEQDLACLHTDALLLHFRLELAAGLHDASTKATARRAALLEASVRRDGAAAAAVFGPRTAKQRRDDEARAEGAGRVTSNPAVRTYKDTCDKL